MSAALCEVPIGRVEEELVGLTGQLSAGLCRWLLLLGEFDRRQGWAGWGIRSCAHWLSIRLAVLKRPGPRGGFVPTERWSDARTEEVPGGVA